jgi:hypothetical protein
VLLPEAESPGNWSPLFRPDGETSIVDFKSTERAQAEDITRDQLHVYAVGYQELTGRRADVVEVLNLDETRRARTSGRW